MKSMPRDKKMKKPLTYDEMRAEALKDFEGCLFYLQHALEGNDLAHFLGAFGQVVAAQGGVGKFAAKTKLTRQSIYNALNSKGLRASSLFEIVKALGLRFDLVPMEIKAPMARRPMSGRVASRGQAVPHAVAA